MLYQLLRPLLFYLEPECAHKLVLILLRLLGYILPAKTIASNSVELMGLVFPNRVGLAAGLDKNAEAIDGLASLGFGFIEVGTVTPKSQPGNPKPRLFRLPDIMALINRMGFNNIGLEQALANIQAAKFHGIIGVNIGKNAATPIENAEDDYIIGLRAVYPWAKYITINISSPNTVNLRHLQQGKALGELLAALKEEQDKLQTQHQHYVPLVVKIAPDLSLSELAEVAEQLLLYKIDGVIATNTTAMRPGKAQTHQLQEAGGLSGKPLTEQALYVVAELAKLLQQQIPIIASGGIMSSADALARIQAGASLVQIYTGLVYQGPRLINEIILAMAQKF